MQKIHLLERVKPIARHQQTKGEANDVATKREK
jgi:hypothetical protein